MSDRALKRYTDARNHLSRCVAELAEVDRVLRKQDRDLAFAEADGNGIVHKDWLAAIKAVSSAWGEWEAAENEFDPG